MQNNYRKHKLFLALGGVITTALPLTVALSCGEASDETKVALAKEAFGAQVRTQTVNAPLSEAINPGVTDVQTINDVLPYDLPANIASDVTVSYKVEAVNGITHVQLITVTLASGSVRDTLVISVTYVTPRILTDDEKITNALSMFTALMKDQIVHATIDERLTPETVIDAERIISLGLTYPLPNVSTTGATVIYRAGTIDGLKQTIRVIISAGQGSARDFFITLTYQPHVMTDEDRVNNAAEMFVGRVVKQSVQATVDALLKPGTVVETREINALGLSYEMPDTSQTGATVIYTAGKLSDNLEQVITVTISSHQITKQLTITLTYKPHVITDQNRIDAAVEMFSNDIRHQSVATTVDHPLLPGSNVLAQKIIALGLTHGLPDTSHTGATVSYEVAALNGETQEVTVTISAGTAPLRRVFITLTYAPHAVTDEQKMSNVLAWFNNDVIVQNVATSVDYHLIPGTKVTMKKIMQLGLRHDLPDITTLGANVTYVVGTLNGVTQEIIGTIHLGRAIPRRIKLVLTYAPHVLNDDEKIALAVRKFSLDITSQTVRMPVDRPLPSDTDVDEDEITYLGLTHPLPNVALTGARVIYHAGPLHGQVQTVTAMISSGQGHPVPVVITLTYSEHILSDDEKIALALQMFTGEVTEQNVKASIDERLKPGAIVSASQLGKLGLESAMPDIASTGVTATYTAGTPNGLVQIVTATIRSGSSLKRISISLTYHPHILSDDEKIANVVAKFNDNITRQTVQTIVNHPLPTNRPVGEAEINLLGLRYSMPVVDEPGVTVTYKAMPLKDLIQVIFVTVSAPHGTARQVRITLTFATRILTDAEKITVAVAKFTDDITSQQVAMSIVHHLVLGTVVSAGAIEELGPTKLMPEFASSDVSVTYEVGAINGLTQRLTAIIRSGTAIPRRVPITLTYAPLAATDAEKVADAVMIFTKGIRFQSVTRSVDEPLTVGTFITAEDINELGLQHQIPDITATGAVAIYEVGPLNNGIQTINVTISLGNAQTHFTLELTYAPHVLTTEEQKLVTARNLFTDAVRVQTLPQHFADAIKTEIADERVIDTMLVTKLPLLNLPSGVLAFYSVGAPDPATITQQITVRLICGSASPISVYIHLTYAGVPLADFKRLYPEKISADGAMINENAFLGKTDLPVNFVLPETVKIIGRNAFSDAVLPSGFTLPHALTTIGDRAFANVKFGAGFTLPSTLVSIGVNAFIGAALMAGFSIPHNAVFTQETDSNPEATFKDVVLMHEQIWHDPQGNRLVNQANPLPGCSIVIMSDDEKIASTFALFSDSMKTQRAITSYTHHLSANNLVTNVHLINEVLPVHLPLALFDNVPVDYAINTMNAVTLTQEISVTIWSIRGGTPVHFNIHLTYPQISLAEFKLLYPGKISDDGKIIVESAFANQTLAGDFALPDTVTTIERYAFRYAVFPPGFTLPSSLTTIKSSSFIGAKLRDDFNLPTSLLTIEELAFQDVVIPPSFTIPAGLNQINNRVFNRAHLPFGFTIPATVTRIDEFAFLGAYLPIGFTLPATWSSLLIGNHFSDVHLPTGCEWRDVSGRRIADQAHPSPGSIIARHQSTITLAEFQRLYPGKLSDDGQTVLDRAFMRTKLDDDFVLPDTVTSIGQYAFESDTLPVGFQLPLSVRFINAGAFFGAFLPAGFRIPPLLTEIKASTFKQAKIPFGFTIPASIRIIGDAAFAGATLPVGFSVPATVSEIFITAFHGAALPWGYEWLDKDGHRIPDRYSVRSFFTPLITPGSIATVRLAIARVTLSEFLKLYSSVVFSDGSALFGDMNSLFPDWARLPDFFGIPSTIKKIGPSVFSDLFIHQSFVIPGSVQTIQDHAFTGAFLPSGFFIPTSVITVSPNAFSGLDNNPDYSEWRDEHGQRLADQAHPGPGAVFYTGFKQLTPHQ